MELFLKLSLQVGFNEGLTQAALIWDFATLTCPAVINAEKSCVVAVFELIWHRCCLHFLHLREF